MNDILFTRQILEKLQDVAMHLNIAEQEIKISKDIIDRAVLKNILRKNKRRQHVRS